MQSVLYSYTSMSIYDRAEISEHETTIILTN